VLDEPLPEDEPPVEAPKPERDDYSKHFYDVVEDSCIMLATVTVSCNSNTRTWLRSI